MCLAEITLFNRRSGEAERMILVDFKKALQGGALDQMIMSTLSVFEQKLYIYPTCLDVRSRSSTSELNKYAKTRAVSKTTLKKILSLPPNTPDPAIYIISGLLPIEAQIDTKSLILFNNICRQNNRSKEKQLAYRQLLIKPDNSNSWYIAIKKLLYKYDFSDIIQFLDNPPKKFEWKNIIQKKVDLYWIHKIIQNSRSYPTLTYLNCDIFLPRKIHPIIDLNNDNNPSKGALSIAIKLKLVTGTFMTQSKRASFTKSEYPLCKLCDDEDEDIEHLLLKCKVLEPIRSPFINQIEDNILKDASISFYKLSTNTQTQLIMDCTKLRHQNSDLLLNRKTEQLCELISRKH
ncbi:unnamed protein product [Mytilus coruscus]|uniref:Reverse transcriptase zinc-binding domain-containing protein n=1 Tax=Mytilus coruscus TaxID=42192 RepID=A0A6J8B7S4_MYTCO|nr:unnamed protein product [Mytilus coruscus]